MTWPWPWYFKGRSWLPFWARNWAQLGTGRALVVPPDQSAEPPKGHVGVLFGWFVWGLHGLLPRTPRWALIQTTDVCVKDPVQ